MKGGAVQRPWFYAYNRPDFVALDCEFVTPHPPEGVTKKPQALASQAIVDINLNVLYYDKVKHPTGSFEVTRYSKDANGFSEDSLKDGTPLETVMGNIMNILRGKFVVLCGGSNDLKVLGYPPIESFDLQDYWFTQKFSSNGNPIIEKIGSRNIVMFYYGLDIQSGSHDPKVDATYTMKVFKEKYVKICRDEDIVTRINPNPFTEFPNFFPQKKPQSKNKKYKK